MGTVDGPDGVGVAPVPLVLVKKTRRGDVWGAVCVAVVVFGFPGRCGRLDLYHRSASGRDLNFLNLAPENPRTCDSVSSLHTRYSATVPKHLVRHCDLQSRSHAIARSQVKHGKVAVGDAPSGEHANLAPPAHGVVTCGHLGHCREIVF